MRTRIGLALVLLFTALMSSCKTDFDVNDKSAPLNVIYGLLDISDSVQYIKIEKTFLNAPGISAKDVASKIDSVYPVNATVTLTEDVFGAVNTYRLTPTKVSTQPTNAFPDPVGYVYTTAPGVKLNKQGSYTITVTNNDTKSSATAQTSIVDHIKPVYPTDGQKVTFGNANGSLSPIKFSIGNNAVVYSVVVRMPYEEYNKSDNTLRKRDTVNWTALGNISDLGSQVTTYLPAQGFYNAVSAAVKVDVGVYRKVGTIIYQVTGGGNQLYNYILVNTPSIGLVQNRPNYTNINNGLGIFSSRCTDYINCLMSDDMFNTLSKQSPTAGLNFSR